MFIINNREKSTLVYPHNTVLTEHHMEQKSLMAAGEANAPTQELSNQLSSFHRMP